MICVALLASCATARYQSFDDVDYGFEHTRTIWGERTKLSIHFATLDGPKDALPIVLLHPWGFNMMVWKEIAPEVAKSRRVVLIDLPGHGKSGKIPGRYPMRRLAAAVLDVMDEVGIERAIVGGNSLGGATSLATALEAPERVAGLILVAAPGGRPLPNIMLRFTDQLATPNQLETLSEEAWRVGIEAVSLGNSGTAVRLREDLIAMRHTEEWPQWCRSTITILRSVAHYEPELEKIQAPVLVIHGEDDVLIWRWFNEGFTERMKRASLVEMKSCGHLAEVECPEQLLPPMEEFLRKIR
jgi:pyruvate dehydrogenase E2 component (dihydrolipoamide acetyltransferase)